MKQSNVDSILDECDSLEEMLRNIPINDDDLSKNNLLKDIEDSLINHIILDNYNLNEVSSLERNNGVLINKQPRFVYSPFHNHSYIEMLYVYKGSCDLYIKDKENKINLKRDDLCILNQGLTHGIGYLREEDIIINIVIPLGFLDTIYMSLISNDVLSEFYVESLFNEKEYYKYMTFNTSYSQNVRNTIQTILSEHYENTMLSELAIKCYIIIIFIELTLIYKKKFDTDNSSKMMDRDTIEILNYIRKNIKTVTLENVANYFHYNTSYLSRLIKQKTNKSFREIVLDSKLKEACILLEKTSMPINTIAKEVGYKNPNRLYKVFKDKYGITPDAYRSNRRIK